MSSITTDQGIVHYEVYGRGHPVILLHGWLGSWGLWQETMAFLGQHYRTYALDFWGFGESGNKQNSYTIPDFVSMVEQFMDQLGIVRAPLIGHSMGGSVSLSMTITHPERVAGVTVIGSPVNGSSLAFLLKLAGYRPIAMLVFNALWALRLGLRITAPLITRDPRWPEMINRDLSKTSLESFLLSISSLRLTNLSDAISQIQVPVMGMYGDKDIIVNPKERETLKAGIPQASIERVANAGHFIMLDTPQRFVEAIATFLEQIYPPQPTTEAAEDAETATDQMITPPKVDM